MTQKISVFSLFKSENGPYQTEDNKPVIYTSR